MQKDQLEELVRKTKSTYKQMTPISCPALGNELIYFNKHGWAHLLHKNGAPRSVEEKLRRLNLIEYVSDIIKYIQKAEMYRKNMIDNHPAYFWTLKQIVDDITIRVVIRQLNGGRKHFFSVMDENNEKIP